MLRLALVGDLHLHERSPRFAHTVEVLAWTVADARARGARVVLLGDLCESAPSPREYAELARVLQVDDGVIQGNHEHPETGMMFDLFGVRHVAWDRFRTVDTDDARLLLVPYPRRGRPPFDDLEDDGTIAGNMRAAAARIAEAVASQLQALAGAKPLLVLGHFTIQGMTALDSTFEVHHATEVVVPQDAFKGAALTAVGHIHSPQDVSADPPIIGVGSLVRHSFAEAGDAKSYTLVTVDAGRVTWERIPVPARKMIVATVQPGDYVTVNGAPIDAMELRGAEIKVTVEIPADQVATFDAGSLGVLKKLSAHFVLEKHVIPTERVRAPELGQGSRLEDQVTAWLAATDQVVDDRRERLLAKVAEVA